MNTKPKTPFQTEFSNAVGMLASQLSLNPTVGQIYGLLYMSPKPVSLNEMVKKLKISKGAASTNVRILESWGAVKKVWVENTRSDYYEANTDTLGVIFKRLKDGLEWRIKDAKSNFEKIENTHALNITKSENTVDNSEIEFYKMRISNAREMYNKIIDLLNLLS